MGSKKSLVDIPPLSPFKESSSATDQSVAVDFLPRENRTFGRRLGRPLKSQRKEALNKLSEFEIPDHLLMKNAQLDPRSLFTQPVEKIWFEIGFGMGEHLLARLKQSPKDGFIGAEPFINGMSALLKGIPEKHHPHLRVYMDDALHILKSLSGHTLDGLYILNPDPWPKKRHHKRRIINQNNLDLFARVLKPGAKLIFSTDVAELAEWTQNHLKTRQDFEITSQSASDPHTPPSDWPLTTKYMAWGISEGRKPHFYVYTKK